MWNVCRSETIFTQLFQFFCFRLSVNDIITLLEEDGNVLSADVYITPPDNYDKSDEDSGDEESANINNLSRHQLLAEAEVRASVNSQVGLAAAADIPNGLLVDQSAEPIASTSAVIPPPSKKRCLVTRKWRQRYPWKAGQSLRAT